MILEPYWSLWPKSYHLLEWQRYVWLLHTFVQMFARSCTTLSLYRKSICYDVGTGVCWIEVKCCSLTRYCAHPKYEWSDNLALHIPTCTVILVLFQSMILCTIALHWATHRYTNKCRCGDIEQNNSQTKRLSSRLSSINMMSTHYIMSYFQTSCLPGLAQKSSTFHQKVKNSNRKRKN